MAKRDFLVIVDLNSNQLLNFVMQNGATADITTPLKGHHIFDTSVNLPKFYNGTTWVTYGQSLSQLGGEPTIAAGTALQYWTGSKTWATLDTSVVPENGNQYHTNARTIASTLTAFASNTGTITAADTVLTAIQKLYGNVNALVTGVASVTNIDGTVTMSGTASAVVVSLNVGHANTWTAAQTFNVAPNISTATVSTIASFDASKNLVSLPLATYPSLAELSYLKGITGPIATNYSVIAGSASIVTVGTITSGAWQSSTKISTIYGGTNADLSGGATGGIVFKNAATTMSVTAVGTQNQLLMSNAAGTPTWQTIDASFTPDSTFKQMVKAATTAQTTLSGPQTIDTVSLVAGDRVLVKIQTLPTENGIYIVQTGAWTRSPDCNTALLAAGATVNIAQGTQGGWLYSNQFKSTDTIGTTAMNWYQIVNQCTTAIPTLISIGTIATGTWNATTIAANHGGTGVANLVGSTITLGGAISFLGAFTTAITVGANTTVTLPTSGTLYGTLGSSITSAQLALSLSDDTGTGVAVFNTTPTFATSVVGSVSMDVFNTISTTVNAFGAATTLNIGATGSATTLRGNVTISGNLTVSGGTTTINATTLTVADINIELAQGNSLDAGAEGGGITLHGLTNKTILWNAGIGWNISEDFSIATGKAYKINNVSVLNSTTLGSSVVSSSLTSVGTIITGVWNATPIDIAHGGTGWTSGLITRKVTGVITGGSTTFAYTHGFTAGVVVQVFNNSGNVVECEIITSGGTTTFNFGTTIPASTYNYAIVG